LRFFRALFMISMRLHIHGGLYEPLFQSSSITVPLCMVDGQNDILSTHEKTSKYQQ